MYVKIGLYLGFVEITLYEMRQGEHLGCHGLFACTRLMPFMDNHLLFTPSFLFPPSYIDFNLVILGPLKLQPKPFPGEFDPHAKFPFLSFCTANTIIACPTDMATLDSSGQLSIVKDGLTCQSKGGTLGNEDIDCWHVINGISLIKSFKGVKTIKITVLNPKNIKLEGILAQTDVSLEPAPFFW